MVMPPSRLDGTDGSPPVRDYLAPPKPPAPARDRFCISCKFGGGPSRMPTEFCDRGVKFRDNPVNGRPEPIGFQLRCKQERADLTWWERRFGHKRCGPEGRFHVWVEERLPSNWNAPPPPSRND